jgi:integrase
MSAPKSLLKGYARTIAYAKPDQKKRIALFDPDTRGLCVRVTPTGAKSYTIVARDPAGKQVWAAVGDYDAMTLEQARTKAAEGVTRIKAGLIPFPTIEAPPVPDTFGDVVANFLKRHCGKREADGKTTYTQRTGAETDRKFRVIILPRWKNRPFVSITRSDVSKLLDDVEDNNGPVMADRTLAALSKLFNWYASRNDNYVSPIAKGMRRTKAKERARKRILSDDELRIIWPVCAQAGLFGALVQVSLLTAQRRAKVASMRHPDIAQDGTWTIPTEKGEKSNAGELVLPKAALEIIRAQPRVDKNAHVFPGRGAGHVAGFSAMKPDLDKLIVAAAKKAKAKPVEPWTLHDLRRTAKSLMARAGVRPDISERVLGHTITGVEGVYDRHDYRDEKAEALKKLAAQVAAILNPPRGNVVTLTQRA